MQPFNKYGNVSSFATLCLTIVIASWYTCSGSAVFPDALTTLFYFILFCHVLCLVLLQKYEMVKKFIMETKSLFVYHKMFMLESSLIRGSRKCN